MKYGLQALAASRRPLPEVVIIAVDAGGGRRRPWWYWTATGAAGTVAAVGTLALVRAALRSAGDGEPRFRRSRRQL